MNFNFKKATATVTAMTMVIGLLPAPKVLANEMDIRHYECDKFNVDYVVTSKWNNGYNVQLEITNTGDETLENWAFLIENSDDIGNTWNMNVSSSKSGYNIISNNKYNHDIFPGETVIMGYYSAGEVSYPNAFYYVSDIEELFEDEYELNYNIKECSENEYILDIEIHNISDSEIEDWKLEFGFECDILDIWNAEIINDDGYEHVINNCGNTFISPGNSASFGMRINTNSIEDLFEYNVLYQIRRASCNDFSIPEHSSVTDEDGNEYTISWVSNENTLPVIKKYTDIELNKLLIEDEDYPVSTLGAIAFDFPILDGNALVVTAFTEVPDLIYEYHADRNLLELVPFSNNENSVSFYLSDDSIIIPVKFKNYIIEESTELFTKLNTESVTEISDVSDISLLDNISGEATAEYEKAYEESVITDTIIPENTSDISIITDIVSDFINSVATIGMKNLCITLSMETNILPYNKGDNCSDFKGFIINENSNGNFSVDASGIVNAYIDIHPVKNFFETAKYEAKLYYSKLNDKYINYARHTIPLGNDYLFSGEGEGSNTVKVEIVRKVDEKEVIIWEQELFTQPEVSSLDSTTQRELLEKYAPIVVYSSDEEYAPMKIEDIFEQIKDTSCTKIKFKSSVGTQNVDINNLSEYMAYNGNSNYLLDWNDALFNSGSKSFKNIKGDFDNSTIYTWFQHEDDKYYLTYYFIYGYDPKTAFGAGNHNLDRESMTVVLNDNFEPESVITGGHLDKSTIFFTDEKYKEIFSWTHERVKTDYELMTSDFSQGHPVVYIEKGQHCVMPLSGYYKNMTSGMTSKNHAGIIQNIYSKENIIVNNIKAIFPESFNTQSDIKIYTTEKMKIDSMYGNNILNFSGYWGDVLGTTNAKFPPFLNRDTDKKTWYVNATEFNTSNINKPNYTRRTEEQFENGYLFSLSNIENISYSVAGDLINVTWDSLDGASGHMKYVYTQMEKLFLILLRNLITAH